MLVFALNVDSLMLDSWRNAEALVGLGRVSYNARTVTAFRDTFYYYYLSFICSSSTYLPLSFII